MTRQLPPPRFQPRSTRCRCDHGCNASLNRRNLCLCRRNPSCWRCRRLGFVVSDDHLCLPLMKRREERVGKGAARRIIRIRLCSDGDDVGSKVSVEGEQYFAHFGDAWVLVFDGDSEGFSVGFGAAPVGLVECEAAGAHCAPLRSAPAGPPNTCSQIARASEGAPGLTRVSSIAHDRRAQFAARVWGYQHRVAARCVWHRSNHRC